MGADFTVIFDSRIHLLASVIQRRNVGFFTHREAVKIVAIQIDREGLGTAKLHRTEIRLNHTIVANARRYQRNKATFRSRNGAFVDDACIRATSFIEN